MNIIIPMAGAGSRFKKEGYTLPKPLIEINSKPMIQMVVENLNLDGNYIYIVRKEHYDKFDLKQLLVKLTPKCTILQVDELTEGAACTTLLAKDFINNNEQLLISNSDQYILWNNKQFYKKMNNIDIDGGILTFKSNDSKWSFVKIDDDNVVEVAEKKVISDKATVGIYYWSKGSEYVKYAEQMISKNIRVNNEFYVAPVYNEAILDKKIIKIYNVDRMWGLGTPEDLNNYLYEKI